MQARQVKSAAGPAQAVFYYSAQSFNFRFFTGNFSIENFILFFRLAGFIYIIIV
jgi:hypothetical protein